MVVRWTYADETLCCPWAYKVNPKSTCETCPFKECILSLKNGGRDTMVISNLIKQVYQYYDDGKSLSAIGNLLKIKTLRIKYWLRVRYNLENKINQYGLLEEYNAKEKTIREPART